MRRLVVLTLVGLIGLAGCAQEDSPATSPTTRTAAPTPASPQDEDPEATDEEQEEPAEPEVKVPATPLAPVQKYLDSPASKVRLAVPDRMVPVANPPASADVQIADHSNGDSISISRPFQGSPPPVSSAVSLLKQSGLKDVQGEQVSTPMGTADVVRFTASGTPTTYGGQVSVRIGSSFALIIVHAGTADRREALLTAVIDTVQPTP